MEKELAHYMTLALYDVISDDEFNFVLETLINKERQIPRFRSAKHGNFNLGVMSDDDIVLNFRFKREHLSDLQSLLGIPDTIETLQRYKVSGQTGLCILLRRLSYPNRLCDIESLFGLSSPYLSVIANAVMKIILRNEGHLISNLCSIKWLNEEKLKNYSGAVTAKGSPLRNCWAFIDGTARRICRPSKNQELYYSGHKRMHCVKYQSILTPDGLIISMHGAYPGRRHDAGIFRESKVEEQLTRLCCNECNTYVIYGDPAYPMMDYLISPFRTNGLTRAESKFNAAMSSVRQAVEWGFQKVIAEFAFVDFSKNQKLLLQDICSMYKVAVILTNCHTCIYGSNVATYFDFMPPTIQEYLS